MRRHHPRLPGSLVAGLLLALAAAWPALAAGQPADRAQTVEALYTLTQFTSWTGPLSLTGEVAVCVLGRDPFRGALNALAGRATRGRRIVVRRYVDPASARGCHVVYVSNSGRAHLAEWLPVLSRAGALTVSDLPRFTRSGGMVGLLQTNGHVGLEVNLGAVRGAGLRLSSRVLRLARIV